MHICNKKQYHPISTWVVHKKYKNKKHPVHGYKLRTIKESFKVIEIVRLHLATTKNKVKERKRVTERE